jgi:hypothetical protein
MEHHDAIDDHEKPLRRAQGAKDTMKEHDKAVLQEWCLSIKTSPSESVGYRYPGCTTEILNLLEKPNKISRSDARNWRPISSDQAAWEFQDALSKRPTNTQQESIARLKAAWTDSDWSPDVAMKSFFDLDAAYFRGVLSAKCRLRWMESQENIMKEIPRKLPKYLLGITAPKHYGGVPTAKIILSAEMCLKNATSLEGAKRETFRTLGLR